MNSAAVKFCAGAFKNVLNPKHMMSAFKEEMRK